jgi:hypothetical protein
VPLRAELRDALLSRPDARRFFDSSITLRRMVSSIGCYRAICCHPADVVFEAACADRHAHRNPDGTIHRGRDAGMSAGVVQVWFHRLYQERGSAA